MKPELSFPEFNREWDYNLFSEIVTNKSKRFDPKNEESLKDIELDSIEQNTGRLLNTYMSKDFTSQKNKFDKGSVLYSKLRPYLNKYYYAKIDGVCSSEIWVLNSLYSQKLSNLFLYYFIQTNRFSNVANKSAGSKMPRADWSLVENIRLYKGSIEEQRKIGDFFSKLDRQIELEEQKLAKLEEQKKGYMQQVFSQELRFQDENSNDYPDWESKKISEIVYIIDGDRGKNYPGENDFSENGDTLFLDTGNVTKNGFSFRKKRYISKEKDEKLRSGKLVLNDFVITSRGTLGNLGYYSKTIENAYPSVRINSAMLILRTKKNSNIKSSYLLALLKGNVIKKFMSTNHVGSAQPHITKKDFGNITIKIPISINEQKVIGDFFNKLDNIIENQSNKIKLLKERKKGFLQKMFV